MQTDKKIVILDGQGGRMGRALIEALRERGLEENLVAVGTNSIATSAMLRAGAAQGATGENAVRVACRDADILVGPLGILAADALMGEVTPAMAVAVGQARAQKVLLPTARCNHHVVGARELPLAELVALAADMVLRLCRED